MEQTQKLIPVDDYRQRRYQEAHRRLTELLSDELIGNASLNRSHFRLIETDLAAAGVTIGQFLRAFFTEKKPVAEKVAKAAPEREQYPCPHVGCGRVFSTPQARSGHLRSCQKGGNKS